MTILRKITAAAASGALSGAVLLSPALAHDFWLMPDDFQLDDAGDVSVEFLIGHSDIVDPWNLRWDRVVALRSYGDSGFSDHLGSIVPRNAPVPGLAKVSLDDPGTHIIGFESYHSFSELEAEKFNDYAESEGLALVLETRRERGMEEEPGRELYSRKAKALIQVGDRLTDNVLAPVGHTLEIVPKAHPYDLGAERSLPVQVLFRGAPLEGALIDLTELESGEEAIAEHRTDADGMATFTVPQTGKWKLNVIWGVPNPGNERAEFESYFTSLTFGYPEGEMDTE